MEELLGDPVIESFPLNIDGDFAVVVCFIFDLRILYRDIVEIVVIILFLHIIIKISSS